MHESNFHVTVFLYGSNTRDAVGRVSHSRVYFDVATAAACSWILAATSSRWILIAIAFSRSYMPEFQHSFPTFEAWILAHRHLQLEGKPHRGKCLRGQHRCRNRIDLLLHH
jgi:hypothetical protein